MHGQVTFGDKPVTTGTVRLESQQGVSQNADLDAEGKYEVRTYDSSGLPPDTYQVAILPRVVTSNEPPLAAPPESTLPPDFKDIPPKFRSVATSGLTIKVERGDNPPFNFDLSK